MEIDREDLRRHYASLSDEELLALDRDELTEVAQKCYDREMERRDLTSSLAEEAAADHWRDQPGGHGMEAEAEPDWLESAAVAASFTSHPGAIQAPEAAQACEVLRAAGVPCQINTVEPDPSDDESPRFTDYQVMVPGALNLIAASILDKEIFNAKLEANWRAHLEELSDEELRVLNPAIICEGFLDRARRLKRAYEDEIARRSADPRSAGSADPRSAGSADPRSAPHELE